MVARARVIETAWPATKRFKQNALDNCIVCQRSTDDECGCEFCAGKPRARPVAKVGPRSRLSSLGSNQPAYSDSIVRDKRFPSQITRDFRPPARAPVGQARCAN
jgi:hypothetical protein